MTCLFVRVTAQTFLSDKEMSPYSTSDSSYSAQY